MTSVIKFTLKELTSLVEDENSCVSKKTVTQNIAFQPWCLSNMKDSVEKILDYKIGKFDKDSDGIILSYKNVKILDDLCAIRQDSSEIYSDVKADLYVFQPYVGATLHGVINKTSVTHLGILVHRVFNVVIPRPSNEPGNKWIGSQLSVGQKIPFKIVVLDLFGALPYIRGCLDENSFSLDELNNLCEENDSLTVSHVNFDGIKPKSSKIINTSNVSSPADTNNSSLVGSDLEKAKNKTERFSNNKDDIRKVSSKKYEDSDSDSISDVDDDLMQSQTNLIKKIMSRDKIQRDSGLKPSFPSNSIGLTKIDKTSLPKTSFIDVRKLKTIQSLKMSNESAKVDKKSVVEMPAKPSIYDTSNSRFKKIVRISDQFENISLIAKTSSENNVFGSSPTIPTPIKKPDSPLISLSPKKRKMSNAPSNKHHSDSNSKNNISFDKNSVETAVTTSTPFPFEKPMKKGLSKELKVDKSKDSKKKLSFSNSSLSLVSSSLYDKTIESDSSENQTKKKKHKKIKESLDNPSEYNCKVTDQEEFKADLSQLSTSRNKQKRGTADILADTTCAYSETSLVEGENDEMVSKYSSCDDTIVKKPKSSILDSKKKTKHLLGTYSNSDESYKVKKKSSFSDHHPQIKDDYEKTNDFKKNNKSKEDPFECLDKFLPSKSKTKHKKTDVASSDNHDSSTSIFDNLVSLKNKKRSKKVKKETKDETKSSKSTVESVANNTFANDNSVMEFSATDPTSKSRKRKRQSSNSSMNISEIASNEFHQSDASSHRKKRRKNNTEGALLRDSPSESNLTSPSNVNPENDVKLSDKKKKKKQKISPNEEIQNGSSISKHKIESTDEVVTTKKDHGKSVSAQEILLQIESDPSLLEAIKKLILARAETK